MTEQSKLVMCAKFANRWVGWRAPLGRRLIDECEHSVSFVRPMINNLIQKIVEKPREALLEPVQNCIELVHRNQVKRRKDKSIFG